MVGVLLWANSFPQILKTELLWTGTKHSLSLLDGCGPSLCLEEDTITPSEHVRVLGVTISSDLGLNKHVSNVCAAGFFRLRQLRRIRRSLDSDSAATLVHAFVSSRVDYCNAIFVGAPKNVTDKLQRVLNAAARKYDHGLTDLMHNELHWLDVPDRVKYKLGMLMYWCQHNQAPRYLMDYCSPVSDVVFRQRLRSASSHQLSVPRHRLSTYGHGRRAFSVARPTVWNSLPDDLRDRNVLETFSDSR